MCPGWSTSKHPLVKTMWSKRRHLPSSRMAMAVSSYDGLGRIFSDELIWPHPLVIHVNVPGRFSHDQLMELHSIDVKPLQRELVQVDVTRIDVTVEPAHPPSSEDRHVPAG